MPIALAVRFGKVKGADMQHRHVTCAVTGANGYVGSAITRFLKQAGVTVYELQRTPQASEEGSFRPFVLGQEIAPETLHSVEVLIHCAYDFSLVRWADILEINVRGSVKLFEAAQQAGVKKIIFISSMAAFEGCRSLYGRAKLRTEKEAASFDALIIRPGMVYGDRPRGLVGALDGLVSGASILPIVGGNQVMYLVHEDDLASLIGALIAPLDDWRGQPIIAASPQGHTFRNILTLLAARKGKQITLVPLPWQLAWCALKLAELTGLRLGFRSDSLVSLINQNPHPDFTFTNRLGHEFRDFK